MIFVQMLMWDECAVIDQVSETKGIAIDTQIGSNTKIYDSLEVYTTHDELLLIMKDLNSNNNIKKLTICQF